MTRARAFKKVIRARAAKTGERYTTARRHVLSEIQRTARAPMVDVNKTTTVATPAVVTPIDIPTVTKGTVSDARAREKTGHGLDYWFNVLDRFGAVDKGHSAAARHLFDVHGVSGWYAQGITVAYERARGVRAVNQRCDGAFEVSVSKVLPAATATVIKAIADTRNRRRWASNVDPQLVKALSSALSGKNSRGFVVRPDGLARFRYKWDDTTVQFYVVPKTAAKVSLTVQHTKLATAETVDERREQWRGAFTALAEYVRAAKP
jgi:hypothetical protein